MGRASRWLRGLLGGKRAATGGDTKPATFTEKRRWGFVRSFREKENTVAVPAIYRDHGAAVDEEAQSKRAIAVAAATAAVAEAAVAAAQAAAAVVRLTSSGRSGGLGFGGVKKDEGAAVKIQAAFRGYLARRALRALRGLVKLQALVRGNIVRKQAAETLRCMQALVRVQARARACRALRSERQSSKHIKSKPSRSHPGPPTPEKYEHAIRAKSDRSGSLKRNSSKPVTTDSASSDRAQSSGWNWLDRWMEERYWDSREAATKSSGATADDEKNAKILEIDTGKPPPQLIPKRRGGNHANHHQYSSCSTLTSDRNSRSFATVVDSPSKDSSVDMPHPSSPLRFPIVDGGDVVDSPQFYSASSRPGSSRRGPFTPAKSECSRSVFSGYSDYPNYMANTESSKAKVRSQSAPRQRREFEKSGSLRRASAGANGFARDPSWTAAAAPALAQRPSSLQTKFANKAYPGSGRLDRLGMPIRYQ